MIAPPILAVTRTKRAPVAERLRNLLRVIEIAVAKGHAKAIWQDGSTITAS
jgi:hypothetical protein